MADGQSRGDSAAPARIRSDSPVVGHVPVDELLLLKFQLGQATPLGGDEPASGFGGAVQFVPCPFAEGCDLVVCEAHGGQDPPRSV